MELAPAQSRVINTKIAELGFSLPTHPNQAETDRVSSRGQKQWEPNGRRTGTSKIKAKITKKSGELVCYVI